MCESVDKMRDVRKRNNDLWMSILDLALRHAPEPTKAIIKEIRKNDMIVAELFDEIASGC